MWISKLWIILFSLPSIAQFYEVTRYADDNGLPSRIVRDVSQDTEGYLWVAGNNGLYKFDGHRFHAFYASLNDTIGLRDNKINTLLAATSGKIWIATPKGLHVLKGENLSYFPLLDNPDANQNHIVALFEDSAGNIWVGSYKGFYRISAKTDEVNYLGEYDDGDIRNVVVWSITEDHKGRIWACRGKNYLPLVAEKGSLNFQKLNIAYGDDLTPENTNLFKFLEYEPNKFLINSGPGLFRGTLKNDSLIVINRFKDENDRIIGNEFIYNSILDRKGNVWTATYSDKIKKYQLVNDQLIELEVLSKNGLQGMAGHAISIYEDSQGNIWVPNANGLFKLSEERGIISTFPPRYIEGCWNGVFSVYAITEDHTGHLWITTPNGLYRFNKQDILDKSCPESYLFFGQTPLHLARTLFVDSENRIWISGLNGISIAELDEQGNPGPFTHFDSESGLPHNWSFDIEQSDPNTFWVTNYIRLLKFHFPGGDLNRATIESFNSSTERDDALINSYTLELETDENDQLWIGTFSGVSRLISEEGDGTFTNYFSEFGNHTGLSNNAIKKIFRDSKDRVWIGTQTGLNLYREPTNDFQQFGRADGLPSEYILGIDEDSEGYLWVVTTSGVFQAIYNESMTAFVHIEYFTGRDGLADNISNKNAIYIDDQDNVFIGSAGGLSVLDVSRSAAEARSFNLALTTIESTQKKRQGFVSIKGLLANNEVKLKHNENSIRLNYAVLDFTDPSFNQYRHKFLPLNENWIETDGSSELTYYNLPPGTYNLVLDGSNNQGIWSESPIELTVIIKPPFWKSILAYIIYGIVLIGLLRFMYLARVRKRVRQLEIETNLEKALLHEREELRKENTADFHDELGSKVTKLSLFLTLAERSLRNKQDPTKWFSKIRDNIKDLSGGFRDLLWVIDPQKDSLSDTFLRLKDFGEELFVNTSVDFRTVGYSESLMHLMLDPQTKKQVVLIFKEAMNNCAKYAECDKVELKITTNGSSSTIELKDNGKGFNVQTESKGRGLKNMMERAKKIGAEIGILSSNKGTAIYLQGIPHSSDDVKLEAM